MPREPDSQPGDRLGGALERLQRLVQTGEARLDGQRADLAALHDVVRQLSSQTERPTGQGAPAWEVLPSEAAPAVLRQLLDGAGDLIRSSVVSGPAGLGLDPEDPGHAQALLAERRMRRRTLYPVEVSDTEAGRAWVASWAGVGEEQRVSLAPPSEFAVFDHQAVVTVAEWGNALADLVVIRDPMLVAVFSALFDRAFAQALPIPRDAGSGPSGSGSDRDDLRLVRLLGLGLKDESIARYLGCSLRTVRRRVAHLMEIHDAQTRFQLGVAVASTDAVRPAMDATALDGERDR